MSSQDYRHVLKHVPGMFDPAALRATREYLNEIEQERQATVATDRDRAAVAYGVTSAALRRDTGWYKCWRHLSDGGMRVIRPFTWVVYPAQVRIVRDVRHSVGWHQDRAYQVQLGPRGHECHITCFVPFDEDPAARTTVQFCARSMDYVEHATLDQPINDLCLPEERVPATDRIHYDLALGDGLVFGDLVLHRTYVPDGARIERRSLEFRLVAPEQALDIKDYFDVESGYFVKTDGTRRENPEV